MKKFRFLLGFVLVFALMWVSIQAQDLPDRVTIQFDNLLPEGIEYDATRGQFILGSWTQQAIFAVASDGSVEPIIQDADLGLINGIHVDNQLGRLLVTSNVGVTAPWTCTDIQALQPGIGVAIYDLASGERLHYVDLSDLYTNYGSFANDVTVDTEGNAYVTDWCAGAIYKVDVDGHASVLLSGAAFFSAEGSFNGIDYHPDGYLIVSAGFLSPNFTESLYKVTLTQPITVSPIVTDIPIFADGITLLPSNDIAVAGVFVDDTGAVINATLLLSSDNGWDTATVYNTSANPDGRFATTTAYYDHAVYSIVSGVTELTADVPIVSNYEIVRVALTEGND